ncbi:MAG TPA: YciI family protein [Polyangiaceae bacterium]|nr:YciI family protein [Polyangiaceae bacterium]
MQFLMLIKIANDTDYEAGKPPPAALEAAMGELMGEWSKTGAFVSAAGLKPTSQAARLRLNRGKVSVSDGPFTEAKEVIGGFFLLEAKDKAAAVEMTRQFVELHGKTLGPDFVLECEVRQVEG